MLFFTLKKKIHNDKLAYIKKTSTDTISKTLIINAN